MSQAAFGVVPNFQSRGWTFVLDPLMKPLAAVLVGYLVLVVAAMLALAATIGFLGTESLLVPGEWRFSLWFAVVGPLILMVPAVLAGYVAGKVAGRMKPAMILAAAVTAFGLAAGSTSIRSPEDYEDRRWTPKFTELIRRVREPLPAMVAGSLVMGGGVTFGAVVAIVGLGSRRPDATGPRLIRDAPGRGSR